MINSFTINLFLVQINNFLIKKRFQLFNFKLLGLLTLCQALYQPPQPPPAEVDHRYLNPRYRSLVGIPQPQAGHWWGYLNPRYEQVTGWDTSTPGRSLVVIPLPQLQVTVVILQPLVKVNGGDTLTPGRSLVVILVPQPQVGNWGDTSTPGRSLVVKTKKFQKPFQSVHVGPRQSVLKKKIEVTNLVTHYL